MSSPALGGGTPPRTIERLFQSVMDGIERGWDPDDPVGYDPETIDGHRRIARENPGLALVQAINEGAGYDVVRMGDTMIRGANAALHGGASLAGQVVDEVGIGGGDQLERDLVGMADSMMGGIGRAGGAVAQGGHAAALAAEQAMKGRYVKAADGSIDLGRVGPEVAAASGGKYPDAPIRMQRGVTGEGGFGARHVSPDKHARAQTLGYQDGVDLIKDVAKNHDVVVEQVNGRLMLVARDKQNRYIILEPRRKEFFKHVFGGKKPFYGVTTSFPEYSRNKKQSKQRISAALREGGKTLWSKDP